MKAIRLTLVSHALTEPQKMGRFHRLDDAILAFDGPLPEARGQVLSAPERRATQTAAFFAPTIRIEPALVDCDLGRWQGVALKHLQEDQGRALAQWRENPDCAPHGGESITQLCQRIATWLQAFDTPGEWLAVTHPMVLRAALIAVLGCPLEAFHRIDVPPLSRLALSHTGQWRLRLDQNASL
ncbi:MULTISPECIES: histidine phosphatase family protein [unclassified Pseudomonas]|uniref:histidine phosphatase family protein n=1 Tax=unclassified Pseudomonas TaxID=196821 RepID=UPI0035BEDD9D